MIHQRALRLPLRADSIERSVRPSLRRFQSRRALVAHRDLAETSTNLCTSMPSVNFSALISRRDSAVEASQYPPVGVTLA